MIARALATVNQGRHFLSHNVIDCDAHVCRMRQVITECGDGIKGIRVILIKFDLFRKFTRILAINRGLAFCKYGHHTQVIRRKKIATVRLVYNNQRGIDLQAPGVLRKNEIDP